MRVNAKLAVLRKQEEGEGGSGAAVANDFVGSATTGGPVAANDCVRRPTP